MASSSTASLRINGFTLKPFTSNISHHFQRSLSFAFKPFLNEAKQWTKKIDVSKPMKNASVRMLEVLVDSMFQFVDQPLLLPSQSNFLPVEEMGEDVDVTNCIEGEIPADFPQGVYLRNGPNPLFGSLKSAISILGKTNQIWVEGEGMLHALYFHNDSNGHWRVVYKNKFVESDTYKLEEHRNMPSFIPTVEGDPLALLAAPLLNLMRYGRPTKNYQNVSIFMHSGKLYTSGENFQAQEIEIATLESLDSWDINGAWNGHFTSHPKVAPGSGELVIMGVSAEKPYYVVGVVSADGKELMHKVDLKLNRSVLSHEMGVTQNYNVIIDHPIVIDMARVVRGGQFMKYEKKEKSRLGVMPRYGDAESVKWFDVEPSCTFHIVNCFEDGDEVVVRGCRASSAIIPGPDWGEDRFEWFSRGFMFPKDIIENPEDSADYGYLFHRVREWRLNMVTGNVKEKFLTGTDFSMDFPFIHGSFTGLKHKLGYTQVIDSMASSISGITKYGSLAKLYFDEQQTIVPEGEQKCQEQPIEVEYHKLEEDVFCTGSAFVPKHEGGEEDGWIVTFVHNEKRNVSQVYIIDAKKFESRPVAVITLPKRVPYGFHGTFISMLDQAISS